ncbi:hypothetical protein HVTV-2_gp70 [Haloarcula virus HVTV-2]|uniref:Uncharacterized protein n=1 Tax=Haloarcula vallismortis tailed virus 1 TaxID=1262528 RepID=L7TKD1_9CAUD|nr:hypothetical protein HVTV1_71 [Haloarcula vallismortis tailed virus 1]AGC34440.1 hypothetical protein HVTV1_71 [Haloarcula vallismortis tailed virus 1]UBF22877.1 hypothetical protein HVTV-2_gp70 [Haloarcula virus HVTV-2]
MTEDEGQRYIKFDDEGALDTFIAMSGLRGEQADELREKVEEHGYGEPIPIPEPENDEE